MKLFLALLFLAPLRLGATTYYVRQDGSATKVNATGPSSDSTKCMSMATHNSSTFSAGDIILISSLGGAITTRLIAPSSGSAGNPITYANAPSETPLIQTGAAGSPLKADTRHDLTFTGLQLVATTDKGAQIDGVCANIIISNCVVACTTYLMAFSGNISGVVLDSITGTGGNNSTIYCYGANNGAITIRNSVITGGTGLSIKNSSQILLTNVSCNSVGSGHAFYFESILTGLVIDCTNDVGASTGFYVNTSTNLVIQHCTAKTSGSFTLNNCEHISLLSCTETNKGGYNVIGNSRFIGITNCVAVNGNGDGFSCFGGHDVNFVRCQSVGCGTKSSQSDGDGFTAHTNDYNISIQHCLSISNTCSGFAMVNNSSGSILNCIAYKNAGDWSGSGGLNQIRGGIFFDLLGVNPTTGSSWSVTNCVLYQNYPVEYGTDSTGKGLVSMDYNCFWPLSSGTIATLNDLSTKIDWATYHATYEPNSFSSDARFYSDSVLTPVWASPLIDRGANVGLPSDFSGNPIVGNPDIGAYEYQHKVIPMSFAGRAFSIPE